MEVEKVDSHWRASRAPAPSSSGQVGLTTTNNTTTTTTFKDTSGEFMSQHVQLIDASDSATYSLDDHRSSSTSLDQSSSEINGFSGTGCQPVNGEPKRRTLMDMMKLRYREICIVIFVSISLFTALNNG